MKYLLFVTSFLFMFSAVSAQDEVKQWRFGIEAGYNSFRLGRGGVFKSDSEREFKGSTTSYQGALTASYRLGANFYLLGKLGGMHVKSTACRKAVEGNFVVFDNTRTSFDTVVQEYLFLEIPLIVRWQIIPLENKESPGLKPFIDFGVSVKFPLSNDSEYGHRKETQGLIVLTPTVYSAGNLETQPFSPYVALGFFAGDHFSASLGWTGVRALGENGSELKYNSTVRSLMLTYFL